MNTRERRRQASQELVDKLDRLGVSAGTMADTLGVTEAYIRLVLSRGCGLSSANIEKLLKLYDKALAAAVARQNLEQQLGVSPCNNGH